MQAFRNSAKPVIYVITIAFFAWLVLDLSGITNKTGGLFTQTTVGKVNGEPIEARTYEALVQQNIDARQRQSSDRLSLEDMQQIRNDVWEQLVQTKVLDAEYAKNDITVSDDEVLEALRTSPPAELMHEPTFQTDSQFDLAKYQRWLTSPSAAPYVDALAAQLKEQLRRVKLFRAVAGDIYLSDAALWQHYRDANETVKIGLTAIIPRNAVPDSAVTVTPAEVAAYYKAHGDDFKRSRTAYMSFVALPRITNAADTAAALERAKAAREEIVKGAPFAEVAKRESADSVSAAKGGDLGEWKKGSFAAPFDSAAFSLPINALSEPVLTQFGYHVIQVTKRAGDKATGRHILIPIEISGAHRDQVDAEADTLERVAAEKTAPAVLDSAARVLHLSVLRADPVAEGGRVQIGRLVVPDAAVWAFQHKTGETSPVIETPIADYVFRLDSVKPAGIPPLAEVRPAVEQAVRDQQKRAKAKEIAAAFLAKVDAGAAPGAVAESMKLPHREFGPFTRVDPPLTNPAIVGAAFGLKVGEHSGVLDTKDGLYVIEVLAHTPADSAEYAKKLDEFRAKEIQQARQDRIRNYLAALRDQAKVVDGRAALEQRSQAQQAGA
jgi:peptidyl-prolyl cis-trans isomerase D